MSYFEYDEGEVLLAMKEPFQNSVNWEDINPVSMIFESENGAAQLMTIDWGYDFKASVVKDGLKKAVVIDFLTDGRLPDKPEFGRGH